MMASSIDCPRKVSASVFKNASGIVDADARGRQALALRVRNDLRRTIAPERGEAIGRAEVNPEDHERFARMVGAKDYQSQGSIPAQHPQYETVHVRQSR